MSLFYSRKKLNSSHALGFLTKPDSEKIYNLFDFNTNNWVKVNLLDFLPYGLGTFRYCNDDENNDNVIMTCKDSYRLYQKNDILPSKEEILAEKEWREKLLESGNPYNTVEYKHCENGWQKAWVTRYKKGDYGVIDLSPRPLVKSFNDRHNMFTTTFTLISHESKLLAKDGTYTPLYTEEEYKTEKETFDRLDEESKQHRENTRIIVRNYKKLCKRYKCKLNDYSGVVSFYDMSDLYRTLRPPKQKLSREALYEKYDRKDIDNIPDDMLHVLGFEENNDYCYYTRKLNFVKSMIPVGGFCNVIVRNATYAGLELNGVVYNIFEKKGDVFTIPEATIENPIIFTASFAQIRFHTDGEVEYDVIEFLPKFGNILDKMRLKYFIGCIFGKHVFISHTEGLFLNSTNNLIELPPETEEELLQSEKDREEIDKSAAKWKSCV